MVPSCPDNGQGENKDSHVTSENGQRLGFSGGWILDNDNKNREA